MWPDELPAVFSVLPLRQSSLLFHLFIILLLLFYLL